MQPLATITHAYFQLYMLSNTRNQYFTSQNYKLPVNPFIIRYIEVQKYLITCYPTYVRVAILLQSFSCLNFYSFLSIHAHKVYMYRNHQQKSNLINFALTTFFGLNIFTPNFGKILRYRYILSSRSLLLFCAVEKNHFF